MLNILGVTFCAGHRSSHLPHWFHRSAPALCGFHLHYRELFLRSGSAQAGGSGWRRFRRGAAVPQRWRLAAGGLREEDPITGAGKTGAQPQATGYPITLAACIHGFKPGLLSHCKDNVSEYTLVSTSKPWPSEMVFMTKKHCQCCTKIK